MKKFLIALAMGLTSLFASAAGGDMALGVNLGVAPILEQPKPTNVLLGLKFQYGLTDPVRLEATFDYGFKDKDFDVVTIVANVHYLFNVADVVRVYPLVGIGYGHVGYNYVYNHINLDADYNRFLFNIGAGAEYDITDKLTLGFELKYQYIKNFGRLPVQLSLAYRF